MKKIKLTILIGLIISSFSFKTKNTTDKELTRKEKSEKVIKEKGIKINYNLPNIESEKETTLRTPKEVAQRVVVLATTNMVAFNGMTGPDAIDYLKKYKLWNVTTPNEKDFLSNPTQDKKSQETWKCEGIWILMWSLKIVDDPIFPNQMCDLNQIPSEKYPIQKGKDPNSFIKSFKEIRSKKEILDITDLYYRLDWACVDARINKKDIKNLNSGVVYERHYALNWLINYMEQKWDDITTDT
jgi:hypothetical protein